MAVAAIWKRAEIAAADLDDPDTASRFVQFALRGLVRLAEDCDVRPVGTLVVHDRSKPDDAFDDAISLGRVRAFDLELQLAQGPVFPACEAVGRWCPVLTCGHVEFGLPADADKVEERIFRHWEVVHSAGDQFA